MRSKKWPRKAIRELVKPLTLREKQKARLKAHKKDFKIPDSSKVFDTITKELNKCTPGGFGQ